MKQADRAESNDYRIFYSVQPSIDIMKMRFSDRYMDYIPADARGEFLARVRDAYNAYATLDDAVEMRNTAREIIRTAQRTAKAGDTASAVEILKNAEF